MRRWVVRACSFAFALVLFMCSVQVLQGLQKMAPFDTDVSFSLNIVDATKPKQALAYELASLGDSLGTTIVKVSPDVTRYRSTRDIIVFAGDLVSSKGPAIEGDSVLWQDSALFGTVLSYDQMGERTLNGSYCARNIPGLQEALQKWGQGNAIAIKWVDLSERASCQSVLPNLLQSVAGLLLPACFLAVIASVLTSLQKRWRQQRIELTEGKPFRLVRWGSALSHAALVIEGLVAGFGASVLFAALSDHGIERVGMVIGTCAEAMLICIGALIAAAVLLSAVAVPTFSELTERRGASRALTGLGGALACAGVLIAIMSMSMAGSGIEVQRAVLEQADAFSHFPGAARASTLATPDVEGNTRDDEAIGRAVAYADRADSLFLSLDVNQAIEYEPSDLEGYDHFVICNERYLKAYEIGLDAQGPGGALYPIPAERVPEAMRAQALIMVEDERGEFPFYRYEGAGMFALGPNVGNGGRTVRCANPIVLVIDQVMETCSLEGMVAPLFSTGNVFFSDYDTALRSVDEAGAGDVVASIDSIFELAMQTVQDAGRQLQRLLVALAVSLALVIMMGFQAAAAWSIKNDRLIFALRTGGRRLPAIALEKIHAWLLLSCGEVLAGFLLQVVVLSRPLLPSLAACVVTLALIVGSHVLFRCRLAALQVQMMVARR